MHLGIAKTPFLHFHMTTKSSNGMWSQILGHPWGIRIFDLAQYAYINLVLHKGAYINSFFFQGSMMTIWSLWTNSQHRKMDLCSLQMKESLEMMKNTKAVEVKREVLESCASEFVIHEIWHWLHILHYLYINTAYSVLSLCKLHLVF